MPKEILLQKLQNNQNKQALPDKEQANRFIEELFRFLFACSDIKDAAKKYDTLQNQLTGLIVICSELDQERVNNFFEQYNLLFITIHHVMQFQNLVFI